jgi:hypothetical protein
MKIQKILEDLIYEGILNEEKHSDLFEFLAQGFGKMTQGTAYYVASMDNSMNKNIVTPEGKMPNPMYGKLYKHTMFMFPWLDTYRRAHERKGIDTEPGQRRGTYERLEGFDMLETGKSGLYLPIYPTGSEYVFAVMDGGKFVEFPKEEAKKYLKPSDGSAFNPDTVPVRQLIIDKIAKITGGGNVWINPNFKGSYMGVGSLDENED